jgi:hypothetical protein
MTPEERRLAERWGGGWLDSIIGYGVQVLLFAGGYGIANLVHWMIHH